MQLESNRKGTRRKQAFIAGPLVEKRCRNLRFYQAIASVCREVGLEPFLPHLQTEAIDKPADASLVFQQDLEGLRKSHILVADVSEPSHGVGSELMQACFQKTPIVCLVSHGEPLSRMVLGNPMVKTVIQYNTQKDCLIRLRKYLLSLQWAN